VVQLVQVDHLVLATVLTLVVVVEAEVLELES
jgi:hypothetical protein